MSLTLFQDIASNVLTSTSTWSGISGALVSWVMPFVLTGLTIQIMWQGYNILRGAGGNHHMIDVFVNSLRAFLVVSLALAGGMYVTNVVGFAQDLRDSLTNLFVPGATNSYSALDSSMDQALQALDKILQWSWNNISLSPIKPNFTGVVAIGCGCFMVGCLFIYALVSVANLLLVDFSLALIFGLGPLFVACLAFQSTARFFDAWLGAVLKYTFTAVVIAAIVGMANSVLVQYTNNLAAANDAVDFVACAFCALGGAGVLILLAIRAPELAGNIVGGIGINALGPAVARAPLAAMSSTMKGTAQGTANAASYGASKVANSRAIQAAGSAIGNSSLGQKTIAATQGLRNVGNKATQGMQKLSNAVTGKGADSSSLRSTMSNAYRIGAGGSGTGSISRNRPLSPPISNM